MVPTDLCWPPREIGESQQEGEESRRVDKAAPELEQVIDGQGVSQEGLSGRPWTELRSRASQEEDRPLQ